MDLCQLIADCIETTPELQQQIANYSSGANNGLEDGANADHIGTNLLIDNSGCDNDNLFGFVTGIIDLFDTLATDALEKAVASTSLVGRIGDVIEAFPFLGLAPADDAFQITEGFITDVLDGYNAAFTAQLRDDMRCGLFCISQDDCELTVQELFWYFSGLLQEGLKVDLQTLLGYIIQGTFIGDNLVYAWNMFISGLLYFAEKFFGVNFAQVQKMVSALYNDPDGDWSTLCSCTTTYFITFDETSSDDWSLSVDIDSGWTETVAPELQSIEEGNLVPAAKTAFAVRDTPDDFEGQNLHVIVTLDAVQTVEFCSFEYWFTHECGNNNLARSITFLDDMGSELDSDSDSGDASPKANWNQYEYTPASPVADVKTVEIRISAVCDPSGNNPSNNYGFVDNIRIIVS